MPKLGKRSLDNLIWVHPNMVKVITEAIKDTPQDFTIVEGVRTTKRQQQLYAQGRTSTGMIVTSKDGVVNKSNHQVKDDGYGHAVDAYPFIDGQVRLSGNGVAKAQKVMADHIKATAKRLGIKIRAGIDWKKPYDPPHFELG